MGIFDFFSKKKTYSQQEIDFLKDVDKATKIYFNSRDAKLNLKDKNGGNVNFIDAFPQIYTQCSQIKSPWDKRMMIFKGIDELFAKKIPPFLYANRLIEDRYANNAFEVLKQTGEPEVNKDSYYWVLSKSECYFRYV